MFEGMKNIAGFILPSVQKMEGSMLWRQGDIYIESVRCVPDGAIKLKSTVLANGELTGHQHRVRDSRTAEVFADKGQLFVDVVADFAVIVHDEHGPIELTRGVYRVWRQREYDPRLEAKQRFVID
jgi:hypothetical protein